MSKVNKKSSSDSPVTLSFSDIKELGAYLRKLRIERNLTIRQVAEELSWGECALGNFEKGVTSKIPELIAPRLANFYQLELSVFKEDFLENRLVVCQKRRKNSDILPFLKTITDSNITQLSYDQLIKLANVWQKSKNKKSFGPGMIEAIVQMNF